MDFDAPGQAAVEALMDFTAMQNDTEEKSQLLHRMYPKCSRLVPQNIWQHLVACCNSVELFSDLLRSHVGISGLPEYLGDLARMELYVFRLLAEDITVAEYAEKLCLNPTLQLFDNTWKNLSGYLDGDAGCPDPEKGQEYTLVWRHPHNGRIKAKPASAADLLAMKMALEELSVQAAAEEGRVHAATVASALIQALQDGVVIGPEPKIKRDYHSGQYKNIDPSLLTARTFTLQWHITQNCDLHCRHCYDRNRYKSLSLQQEIKILDNLARFCSAHNVQGQVVFTGGNPLLHRNFEKLYQEAADRGFFTAILGNPTNKEQMERLVAIQPPAYYQISLEGLEEHNDFMRGRGHFKRVMAFLELLRQQRIFSMVMLTLTRDNMDQVLPLGEILRNKTDLFTFNRLSAVGEGANLVTAAVEKYPGFLRHYDEAARSNPALGLKDNLINILYHRQKRSLFGGCTGFGCGAAFNFIAVLPDGSVHACRKFPSPLGNILHRSLNEIYHSDSAKKYRNGAVECRECAVRPACGGCLAVAYSHGREIFIQKDPYCFIEADNESF